MRSGAVAYMKKRDIIFGLIIGALGVVLAVGAQTFAHPCAHADGSAAMCAPTKTWLTVAGGLIAVLAGVSMLRPRPWAQSLTALGGLAAILVPGVLVPLCAASAMRCRAVTKPFALVTGVLVILLSAWQLALILAERRREARS